MRKAGMEKRDIKVGVVGAGVVGSGTIEILLKRAGVLQRRSGVNVALAAVAELDKERARATGASDAIIVGDYKDVTENPEIDIVVELVGGTGIAETIVKSALENSKAVVTANKALLSEKGEGLFALAREKNVPLAFEAAVGGGIPCILAIREGLNCNEYDSLLGILNGTCNYILTEMIENGVEYETCLKEAQELGFAEADPTTDVGGFDTGHKLALLSALAFETNVPFSSLHIEGIDSVDLRDVRYAAEHGYTVKLLAVARPDNSKLYLSVHPALLPIEHPLAGVHGSLNAVSLYGDMVMESVLIGRGAGKLPTASAVVADIVYVARSLSYESAAPCWVPPVESRYELADMSDYKTRYYLRFNVDDTVGVMARIADTLSKKGVSIASVNQKEADEGAENVAVVFITHLAREGDIQDALAELNDCDFVQSETVLMRIEE